MTMSLFKITEPEITRMAKLLGLDLEDPERTEVLRCLETCEVQAGPGTGKTTLLVAKLTILADQWPYIDKGVCVLSHTNAARREIERALSKSPGMNRLLEYPHFIGTLQTFFHCFLALPYLHQHGCQITVVDDERYGRRAVNHFNSNLCHNAKLYLGHGRDKARIESIIAGLRYKNRELDIEFADHSVKIPGKKSGQELEALKKRLSQEGYFRFDDMYALAERAICDLPYLIRLIEKRFPWVLIDELQDTNAAQNRLLRTIFNAGRCIVQSFGDRNQAIFDFAEADNDELNLFGQKALLYVSSTKRFGTSIATLASGFTAIEKQTLNGDPKRTNRRNTIFIFERDAVEDVVYRFAELVHHELEINSGDEVYLIGSRKRESDHKSDTFPTSLSTYWRSYTPEDPEHSHAKDSLIGCLHVARRRIIEDRRFDEATNIALSAIMLWLRRCPLKDSSLVGNRPKLNALLQQGDLLQEFKRCIWVALNPEFKLDEHNWGVWLERLSLVFKHLLLRQPGGDAVDFVKWHPFTTSAQAGSSDTITKQSNLLLRTSGNASFPIRFSTIHGVKGQSHKATLVVDTYVKGSHDLKQLLPVLTGRKHGSDLTGSEKQRCKRAFVGMTRPSELLCLAIFRDHLNVGDEEKLSEKGWIVELVRRDGNG